MFNDWGDSHLYTIKDFILYLNSFTNSYILKGGTSLMLFYGLDRFSEDIGLDLITDIPSIIDIVKKYCESRNFSVRIAKNTDTVKRCFINYNGQKPLKVEVSYRNRDIGKSFISIQNGVAVYTIQRLASLKTLAYINRDKIRDLYDVTFIFNNYYNLMPSYIIATLADAIEAKGLSYFDYIIKTQSDGLIDNDKLASDFLDLYFKLGFGG